MKKRKRSKRYEKPLKINATFDEVIKMMVSEDAPPKYGAGGTIMHYRTAPKKPTKKDEKEG